MRRQDGGAPYGEPPSRRLNMKVHANILGSILLAAALSAVAAEPTKVVFFFDTEDFIQPRSSDAIRDMANVLASEGVKGHFAMVGYLGKKLVDWRPRQETCRLAAVRRHRRPEGASCRHADPLPLPSSEHHRVYRHRGLRRGIRPRPGGRGARHRHAAGRDGSGTATKGISITHTACTLNPSCMNSRRK